MTHDQVSRAERPGSSPICTASDGLRVCLELLKAGLLCTKKTLTLPCQLGNGVRGIRLQAGSRLQLS